MFRFIHTADIHLDSPLKSLALRDPEVGDLVFGATRRALEKIIDLCLEEQVDALIIAGDLYDGDLRSMKTAAFLSRQMRRLEEAKIKVFMIRGNHDSESSITNHLNLPPNVHVFTGHGGVIELKDLGVAIHGVSYVQHHVSESMLPKYKSPVNGLINIGIMHTSVDGAVGHDDYAPCPVNDLVSHGFDYWALGHIHQRRIYAQNPFVVMPGIPQGRSVREDGPKSVTLVKVYDKEINIEERFVADSEFRRVEVDISNVGEWPIALNEIKKALEQERHASKAQHIISRVVIRGQTPLFWCIQRDADLFEEEVKDTACQFNNIFIDKIDNEAVPPAHETKGQVDPVYELETLMLEISKNEAFLEKTESFLDTAVSKLPPELRNRYGKDSNERKEALKNLLSQGTLDVIAALKGTQTKSEEI